MDDDPDMAFLTSSTVQLANDGLVVSGVAATGDEAIACLSDADVVVLDFRMPGRNGLEVAAEILAVNPGQAILLFSAYLDDATVAAAQRMGVRECLSKDRVLELPAAIRRHCPPAA